MSKWEIYVIFEQNRPKQSEFHGSTWSPKKSKSFTKQTQGHRESAKFYPILQIGASACVKAYSSGTRAWVSCVSFHKLSYDPPLTKKMSRVVICHTPVIGVRSCINVHHGGQSKAQILQKKLRSALPLLTSKYSSKMSSCRKIQRKWTIFGTTYYVFPTKTIILNSNHGHV